ncbi:MAG: zinc-binding protein [Chloroflexi bacterium RBG_16_48_7]|nr:MAG: zinc-binding protein [Chloroflexi bacterium RBG_16_48_7]
MSFQDKTLTCSDCGQSFTFSAAEQETFKSRGYTNEPKRCLACRDAKRSSRPQTGGGNSNSSVRREMFPATCAQCGRDTKVPFEPRSGRPVYCSECYSKVRTSH